jgi:ABC-2 type transport system permease protein
VLDFAQYPLTIYAKWLRFAFTFVLPLGAVSFWPSVWLLRAPSSLSSLVVLPWTVAVWGMVSIVWKRGVRRYQSAGT